MLREIGSQAELVEGNPHRLAGTLGGQADLPIERTEPMAEQIRAFSGPWDGPAIRPANLVAWKMLLPGTQIVISPIG